MSDQKKEVLVIDLATLTLLLDKILGELAAQRAQDHEQTMALGGATNTLLTAALTTATALAKNASEQHIAADVASQAASDALQSVSEANRHAERMFELETERKAPKDNIDYAVLEEVADLKDRMSQHEQFGSND